MEIKQKNLLKYIPDGQEFTHLPLFKKNSSGFLQETHESASVQSKHSG